MHSHGISHKIVFVRARVANSTCCKYSLCRIVAQPTLAFAPRARARAMRTQRTNIIFTDVRIIEFPRAHATRVIMNIHEQMIESEQRHGDAAEVKHTLARMLVCVRVCVCP